MCISEGDLNSFFPQGYRMLATLCPICECVELQDRQGAKYCVACQEVIVTFDPLSYLPGILCYFSTGEF